MKDAAYHSAEAERQEDYHSGHANVGSSKHTCVLSRREKTHKQTNEKQWHSVLQETIINKISANNLAADIHQQQCTELCTTRQTGKIIQATKRLKYQAISYWVELNFITLLSLPLLSVLVTASYQHVNYVMSHHHSYFMSKLYT